MDYFQGQLPRFYHYVNNEISDPRMTDYPMLSSPWPMLSVFGFYIYFVKSLGPRLMENRKPFKLDRLIQVYNVIQIGLNVWIIKMGIELRFFTLYSLKCQPVDYSNNPHALEVAKHTYAYFLIKLLDLLDTLFFVLRKKNNQISKLHVFHHAGMLLVGYIGAKYVPGGHSAFFGLLNCAVHAVMYSYYLVTSLYPQHKQRIWWKKHITQMQMVQFLLLAWHQGQLLFRKCDYPMFISVTLTPLVVLTGFSFYDFYKHEYGFKKSERVLKNQ